MAIAQLLCGVSHRITQDLAAQLHLTVHLGLLEDGMVAYVDKVSTPTAFPPYTITDRALLRAELNKIRAQGFAVDDREYHADMRCIAVPIHDGEGCVVAALSVTGEIRTLPIEKLTQFHTALMCASAKITQRLGPIHKL